MSITNNLYPPLVMDAQPAFIRNQDNNCKIYFSFSSYNTIEDVKNIQVTLVNQKSNQSALDANKYPSGIKLIKKQDISAAGGDYSHYITIALADLQNREFGLNEFYKVQLRLTSTQASDPSETAYHPTGDPFQDTGIATWLYDNRDYFSEWSTVCLIKGIEQPHIQLNEFEQNQTQIFNVAPVNITGSLYYKNDIKESEHLDNYIIKIIKNNEIIDQGKIIYTNNYAPNEINYKLKYNFDANTNYSLKLSYETNNGYKEENLIYNFIIEQGQIDPMNCHVAAIADQENGRNQIRIVSNPNTTFQGTFIIRRTSSKDDFATWEDIKKETFNNEISLDYTWYDMTIEGGIWYQYCVQRVNETDGRRGTPEQTFSPIINIFEDMFLTKGDIQLKVQFNPTLGEYKYNVTESQQVTLGSQFPFIKRNSNNFYRTFSIGGLITVFSDLTNWYDPHFVNGIFETDKNEKKIFTSRDELFGNSKSLYESYNTANGVNDYTDFIYEKAFREKVQEFLYQDDIKLFRSITEGNILIKLMNVSFQPNEQLGRTLYSFTASAVEIDKDEYDNYIKYGIVQEV